MPDRGSKSPADLERWVEGLRKAGLQDRARTDDLNLLPENRLSGAELRESLKSGYRRIGREPSGIWMRDMDPHGNGVHYWEGSKVATSTSEIRGDLEYTQRSDRREQSCSFYRDSKGTKEDLNEFVSVCSHGIFPHARFPLPETTR